MSLNSKRELLEVLRPAYAEASWSGKTEILDSFTGATGYCRKYAVTLLSRPDKPMVGKRARKPIYGDDVCKALTTIWLVSNRVCSKRLIPFLPVMIAKLESTGYLVLPEPIKESLLTLSAATADRLLKAERQRLGRSRSYTRKGHWLRNQIDIKTFSDWSDDRPGFFEVDLVTHNGGNPRGQCVHTLTVTDIATGWTELIALPGKGELSVIDGLRTVVRVLPMALLGLDTDNGGEFINHNLANFCTENSITFTRSRPYKKNDQAHVEEKNGSLVRKFIGHNRYDTDEAYKTMVALYRTARLYINYFQPSFKLKSKVRIGSTCRKQYHTAKTPAQQLLAQTTSPETKRKLERAMRHLDPVALLVKMEALQKHLHSLSSEKPALRDLEPAPIVLPALKEIPESAPPVPRPVNPAKSKGKPKTGAYSLSKVSGDITKQLELEPHLSGRELLNRLIQCHPGVYDMQQLTQMQRLVRDWRLAHPEHLHKYPPSVRFELKHHFRKNGIR